MMRLLCCLVLACTSLVAADTFTLRAVKTPLLQVLERIALDCDAGLVIDRGARDAMTRSVTINVDGASWDEVVSWVEHYGCLLERRGETVLVRDHDDEVRKQLQLRTYNLDLLTYPPIDRSGPRFGLPDPGAESAQLVSEIVIDNDLGAPYFSGVIRALIEPQSWERIDGVSIDVAGQELVVSHLPRVLDAIDALLLATEQRMTRQVVITCYELPPGHPAAAQGLLDAEAWAALRASLPGPFCSGHAVDGWRQYIMSGSLRAVLHEQDVAGSDFDPVISVVADGVSLDFRAEVTVGGVVLATDLAIQDAVELRPAAITSDGRPVARFDLMTAGGAQVQDQTLIPPGAARVLQVGERVIVVEPQVVDGSSE